MIKNNVLIPILFVLTLALITAPGLQDVLADNTFSDEDSPPGCFVNAAALAIGAQAKARSDVRETVNVDLIALIAVNNACDQVIVSDITVFNNAVPICTISHHDNVPSVRINAGDPQFTLATCPFFTDVIPLNPDGNWVIAASYQAEQLDGNNSPADATIQTQVAGFAPAVSLEKDPDRDKVSILECTGTPCLVDVEYTFTASYNPGSDSGLVEDLFNCVITDDTFASPVATGITLLTDGTPFEIMKTFGLSQTTMNEATLTCPVQSGPDVSDKADTEVKVLNPAVDISKSTDDKVIAGEPITYLIKVTNTGDTDLTNCLVVDSLIGNLPAPFDGPFNLAVGVMTPLVPVVDADGVQTTTTNTADVECEVQEGPNVTDSDSETVTPVQQGVTLEKIVRGEPEKVYRMTGDDTVTSSIDYDYTICSTAGSASLVCSLFDDVIGNGVDPLTSTAIQTNIVVPENGGCNTATANHVISNADVIAMEIKNNALVSCLGQEGLDPEIATADAQVDVLEWDFSVTDVCTPDSQVEPGEITWTIEVTNESPDLKSLLTIDVEGTFYTVDANSLNRVFLDDAADKDRTGLVLAFTDGTTPGISYDVTRSDLQADWYLDEVVVTATDQAGNSFTRSADADCHVDIGGEQGCTPGYWKANAVFKKDPANAWTVEKPGETLADATFVPQNHDSSLTLLEALKLKGGEDAEGMEGNLLRHCVAAKLNAENTNVGFPLSADAVIAQCNVAMATEDRDIMETLKDQLDDFNNAGCSINMKGEPEDNE